MLAYTLMLCVTSTIAYATIFVVLFGWDRALAIAIGGAIVLVYSTIGGMWSITLTDLVQFIIKTIGIFFLMLPFTLNVPAASTGIRSRGSTPASSRSTPSASGRSSRTSSSTPSAC